MKTHPQRCVPTHAITAGDGFQAKLELPAVAGLVQQLRTRGKLPHPVVVRLIDMRVVTGEDVLAAHVVLKMPDVMVTPVELDDGEYVALRLADEARISMGRGAEGAAIDELLSVVEKRVDPVPRQGKTPPKSQRSVARELVAELIGTTPSALRKADERRSRVPGDRKPRVEPWRLECYGNNASAELLSDVEYITKMLASVDASLRAAQGNLTRLDDTRLGHARYSRVHEAVHAAAALVRSFAPHALCPYCKDIAAIRTTCGACWGGGYVNRNQYEEAPVELRTMPCVSHAGQLLDSTTLRPYEPVPTEPYEPPVFDDTIPDYEDEHEPPREYVTQAEPDISDEPDDLDEVLPTVDDEW